MNRKEIIKLLMPLMFLAVFSLRTLKAETTPSSDVSSTEEAQTNGEAVAQEGEPTLPLTILQFDAIRKVMAQAKADSDALQVGFQKWLDDILGTAEADQKTDSAN